MKGCNCRLPPAEESPSQSQTKEVSCYVTRAAAGVEAHAIDHHGGRSPSGQDLRAPGAAGKRTQSACRWMARLKRAFHAMEMERQQARIVRLERAVAKLE